MSSAMPKAMDNTHSKVNFWNNLCVCVCVCVCARVCVFVCVCVRVYMHAYVCVYMYFAEDTKWVRKILHTHTFGWRVYIIYYIHNA